MFSAVRRFVRRHRRKFLVSSIVLGGVTFCSYYAHRKLLEWQEREMNDLFERSQRQQHFERNESTCNQTILTLTPALCEEIGNLLNAEQILEKIKAGSADKVALWDELKVISFTRLAVLLYAGTLFVIMLRAQVNIMGGFMYNQLTSNVGNCEVDKKLQEDYLSLCEYFIKNGVKCLSNLIETKVTFVLEGEPLKKQLRLQDIEHYFWAIQSTVSSDPDDPLSHLSKYLLPNDYITEFTKDKSTLLCNMVNETVNIFESTEVTSLARTSVNSGLLQVMEQISEYYDPINRNSQVTTPSTSSGDISLKNNNISDSFIDFHKITMPMAKVVPIIHGLSSAARCSGTHKEVCNKWIQQFINMKNLRLFGANIYESFSNFDVS